MVNIELALETPHENSIMNNTFSQDTHKLRIASLLCMSPNDHSNPTLISQACQKTKAQDALVAVSPTHLQIHLPFLVLPPLPNSNSGLRSRHLYNNIDPRCSISSSKKNLVNPSGTSTLAVRDSYLSSLCPPSSTSSPPSLRAFFTHLNHINKHVYRSITDALSVKAKRKRTTPYQTHILQHIYNQTAFPNAFQRKELAVYLDMSPRAIQIWFQNKRQAMKKARLQEHRPTTIDQASTTVMP